MAIIGKVRTEIKFPCHRSNSFKGYNVFFVTIKLDTITEKQLFYYIMRLILYYFYLLILRSAIFMIILYYFYILDTNVIVNAVNPGNVETNIYRNYPSLSTWWLYALQWPIRLIIIKRPHQGVQTVLHALLTSNRSTGQYFSECKLSLPSPIALNESLSKEYYNLTLEILDSKFITESEC